MRRKVVYRSLLQEPAAARPLPGRASPCCSKRIVALTYGDVCQLAGRRFNRVDPFFGNPSDPAAFHKYLFAHGDPINRIDPQACSPSQVSQLDSPWPSTYSLPTLVQGNLTALTLGTIGQVGGDLRRAGTAALSLPANFDEGMFLYALGNRIIEMATFTTETIVNATQAFFIATAAIGIGRAALALIRSGRLSGGAGLAFQTSHWFDELPSGYPRPSILQSGINNCGQTSPLRYSTRTVLPSYPKCSSTNRSLMPPNSRAFSVETA